MTCSSSATQKQRAGWIWPMLLVCQPIHDRHWAWKEVIRVKEVEAMRVEILHWRRRERRENLVQPEYAETQQDIVFKYRGKSRRKKQRKVQETTPQWLQGRVSELTFPGRSQIKTRTRTQAWPWETSLQIAKQEEAVQNAGPSRSFEFQTGLGA